MPLDYDVIVIGAGAAGMMCAAQCGQRGRRVLLIEHYHKLGEKIRISGGGRCNFTNLHCKPENFLSRNKDFCRSALARYTPQHFIALAEKYGIRYHEKTRGQLFCDESSLQIINLLRTECDRGRVKWRMPCAVNAIVHERDAYTVHTDQATFSAAALVVASGGLTVPKIGASPFGYKIAEQFGLRIIPPKPALVPLSLDPELLARFGDLSGISVDAEVSCNEGRFRENLLLTHRGLSGPAILQISSYWQSGPTSLPIHIDLLPGQDARRWLNERRHAKTQLHNILAEQLPKRFAQQWCEAHDLAKPVDQYSEAALTNVAEALHNWQIKPSGTLGYNKAEVTLGGVDTSGLSSKTMEATTIRGLYFIGEVVDVTGHLGGFNFQWAWASGHAAGNSA
jgi:predicted Rossmann fold flavoprotein